MCYWIYQTLLIFGSKQQQKLKKLSLEFQFGDNLIISPLNTYNFDTIGTNKFKFLHFLFFHTSILKEISSFLGPKNTFWWKIRKQYTNARPQVQEIVIRTMIFAFWSLIHLFLLHSDFHTFQLLFSGPYNQKSWSI